MKIAMIGAGGTGKGTLAREIAKSIENLVYIPSTVESVGRIMFPDSKNYKDIIHSDKRLHYQYAAVMAEMQLENIIQDEFIAERSVFDYLAYVQDMSDKDIAPYEKMIFDYHKKYPYDIMFYLPADDFKPYDQNKAAKWKERDEESRIKTNKFIQQLLFASLSPVKSNVYLLRGSLETRLELALNYIKNY